MSAETKSARTISVDLPMLKNLRDAAVHNETLDKWSEVALTWAESANTRINELSEAVVSLSKLAREAMERVNETAVVPYDIEHEINKSIPTRDRP